MASPALEVIDLVKSYGDSTAVDGLSLSADRGEVLALLGPNGAGKTTTVEICEGFRAADSGSVRVLGLDPQTQSKDLKPRVGVMLQEGVGGYQAAKAGELLRLFATYAAHPMDTGALLDRIGLTEHADRPVKSLSGGQQQRLSLALALVARPELVFLDEPTAGMDPQSRRSTWELVEQLRADGVSVLLTTHFLDEAEHLADTVVVIDRGKVVAAGTPAELTRSGSDSEARLTLIGDVDAADASAALPGTHALVAVGADSYLLRGGADPGTLAALATWCAERDVQITRLDVARRSLEDVFLELTGRQVRS